MFPDRFFAPRFFAPRFFPRLGAVVVEVGTAQVAAAFVFVPGSRRGEAHAPGSRGTVAYVPGSRRTEVYG